MSNINNLFSKLNQFFFQNDFFKNKYNLQFLRKIYLVFIFEKKIIKQI